MKKLNNKKQNVIILILTGLSIMLFAFTSKGQTMAADKHKNTNDSVYFLSVSKGEAVTFEDMDLFHESDYMINNVETDTTRRERIVIFYNDTPVNFCVYSIYILQEKKVIKSRCIRVYYKKG